MLAGISLSVIPSREPVVAGVSGHDMLGVRRHDEGEGRRRMKTLSADEVSLQKLGQWPWPRDLLAQMVDRLTVRMGSTMTASGIRDVEAVVEVWTAPSGHWTLVQTYTDGAQALDGLRANPPDLAIFDIKMPRMDGMELLRRLNEGLGDRLNERQYLFLVNRVLKPALHERSSGTSFRLPASERAEQPALAGHRHQLQLLAARKFHPQLKA